MITVLVKSKKSGKVLGQLVIPHTIVGVSPLNKKLKRVQILNDDKEFIGDFWQAKGTDIEVENW